MFYDAVRVCCLGEEAISSKMSRVLVLLERFFRDAKTFSNALPALSMYINYLYKVIHEDATYVPNTGCILGYGPHNSLPNKVQVSSTKGIPFSTT